MDKKYDHRKWEEKIYKIWEKSGYFNPDNLPEAKNKTPYTIILPPPNASGRMHTGNVLMIAIQDLLIRWKRMQGYAALWLPGTDHAGFETQITFERNLKKKGRSRFDFDRKTLYKKIEEFVKKNKRFIENQIRSMGASVDWSRYKFTLDKEIIDAVYDTFIKMYKDGLVYRDEYIVNYCPKCGTTFADLEVKYVKRKDPLYYMQYGPFTLATVRPETKFGDTAVAVHPDDKRYKDWIGKKIKVKGLHKNFTLQVIADKAVDPEFGTGVVKVTPAHDKNDYEIGKRHNLEMKKVIDWNGKLNEFAGHYAGLSVKKARGKVVADLKKKGMIKKIDKNYTHRVALCYKGGHDIEPMIMPNWFIKVNSQGKSLKKPAGEVVRKGKVKIYPSWHKKTYLAWIKDMHDWPVSRQIVWGIRIPVWYSIEKNPDLIVSFLSKEKKHISGRIGDLLNDYQLEEISEGLQTLIAPKNAKFTVSKEKPGGKYLPETDTFDTWFSSGQWPLVALGSNDRRRFYPTDVMETGWEILRLWVSRMIMFGLYLTGKVPFHTVYLHGIVRALDGRKMSKSLGNVINPEEYQEKYGTDALRMGLVAGTATGQDFNFPHDKVTSYRNFANKIWNIARFINLQGQKYKTNQRLNNLTIAQPNNKAIKQEDKKILEELNKTIKTVNDYLEKFKFAQAAEVIYHFVWDKLASDYMEKIKVRLYSKKDEHALKTLVYAYSTSLKLLHPFMPFVTEAVWQQLFPEEDPLIISLWPKAE